MVDRGAGDDPTARVAEVYPRAYVRRLPRARLFTEACNVAFESIEGATFFLVCRDDVVVEPRLSRGGQVQVRDRPDGLGHPGGRVGLLHL